MNKRETLEFLREYKRIYKVERYASIAVSIITLIILLSFFGYQTFTSRDSLDDGKTIANGFIGLGSTGIITIAIGYIYKFMDKALEAAKEITFNSNKNQDENKD